MTLTHSRTLSWADSVTDVVRSNSLNALGSSVVREMSRIGLFVDLSHVSPETMHDAIDMSTAPVIFSHSNAKALVDHVRNVPDDVLRKFPKNSGVVMVTFAPGFYRKCC